MVHSRMRLRVRASSRFPSGAWTVSMRPVARSSPVSEVESVCPVRVARLTRANRRRSPSAPQSGGSAVMNPSAWTSPRSPVRSAFTASRLSVPSLRNRPRSSPLVLSVGKARRIPSNDERVEDDVGRERERVPASVEIHGPGGRAGRPVAVLLPGGAAEGDVLERAVEGARRGEPPFDDHGRRETAHGPEVDVRAAHHEMGEREPAVPGRAHDAGPRDLRHRPARHARVGEGPVDRHVHGVEEPGTGDASRSAYRRTAASRRRPGPRRGRGPGA